MLTIMPSCQYLSFLDIIVNIILCNFDLSFLHIVIGLNLQPNWLCGLLFYRYYIVHNSVDFVKHSFNTPEINNGPVLKCLQIAINIK